MARSARILLLLLAPALLLACGALHSDPEPTSPPSVVELPSFHNTHRVPVPSDWQINPPPEQQEHGWLAVVPAGSAGPCRNMIWYELIVNVDAKQALALVRSGNLRMTAAIKHGVALKVEQASLDGRSATLLTPAAQSGRFRRIYLVPYGPGVLIVHCLTVGQLKGEERCAQQHPALATQLRRAFERAETGLALGRRRARREQPPRVDAGAPCP
jgi:hypothetical protein